MKIVINKEEITEAVKLWLDKHFPDLPPQPFTASIQVKGIDNDNIKDVEILTSHIDVE